MPPCLKVDEVDVIQRADEVSEVSVSEVIDAQTQN